MKYAFLFFFGVLVYFSQDLDLRISASFFQALPHPEFWSTPFVKGMYEYGTIPGWLGFFGSLLFYFVSFRRPSLQIYRRYVLVPILTMVLGAGFFAQLVFKDHWGRPRPRQILEFGGNQAYRPFYKPDFTHKEPSKSFPSGHCCMGFYFFSFAYVARCLKNRFFEGVCHFIAFVLGSLLGFARIAQGGHFFTDVLASAALMWGSAFLVDQLIFEYFSKKYEGHYRETA